MGAFATLFCGHPGRKSILPHDIICSVILHSGVQFAEVSSKFPLSRITGYGKADLLQHSASYNTSDFRFNGVKPLITGWARRSDPGSDSKVTVCQ